MAVAIALSVDAPSRAARASAAAGVALTAAAAGHLAAGGAALSAPGMLAAAVALALPAWWLTGRERSWGLLAGALIGGQLGAHALFNLTTGTSGQVTELAQGHHQSGWLPADLMLLAHLLAAAVGAAWLRRGERRAWAAARRAAATVHRILAVLLGRPLQVPADLGVVRWNACEDQPVNQPAVLRNTIILRGPPLGA